MEIWAIAARDEVISKVVRDFYRGYVDHVCAFVQRAQPALSPEACRAKAETFVALIEGASLLRSGIAGHRSDRTDTELAATAVALLVGAR